MGERKPVQKAQFLYSSFLKGQDSSGLVWKVLEKYLTHDKWRSSGYRSGSLSRWPLGSRAGGNKKEATSVKVSIYTNMKRPGARDLAPWRLSSYLMNPGSLPSLGAPGPHVQECTCQTFSFLSQHLLNEHHQAPGPELCFLQALSGVVFSAHRNYSTPVGTEEHWDPEKFKRFDQSHGLYSLFSRRLDSIHLPLSLKCQLP